MKILSFALPFLFILVLSCASEAQENLGPQAFVQKIKATPNAQLLDVRTPKEWEAGKIASSKCMNFMDADFKQQVEKLNKTKPVFVYCAAGGRSAKASQILKDAGFKVIYNLQGGGYSDLAKEGIK